MLGVKPRPATYADIEALPEHKCGEILFGVLHVHRYPPRVSYAAMALLNQVAPFDAHRRDDWWLLRRPELHLDEHVIVPDIAGWRRETLPLLSEDHIRIRPDWVAELIQPSTLKLDRTDKLAVYAEFGVKHCWYVDPIARSLEVFALTNGKWRLATTFKDNDAVNTPPFEVHSFALDMLWVPE